MYLFKVNLCISEQFLLRAFWSFVEHEQLVVIYKDGKDTDFGLHIFDSHPAFITEVDHGKRYSTLKDAMQYTSNYLINILF